MLQHAVIVYETEDAARDRLTAHGYAPDIAAEIAVYLAQATDLAQHMTAIAAALQDAGMSARFVELDRLPEHVPALLGAPAQHILWCLTDGIRFYRGAAVPALARLLGVPRFGAPPAAQHLCQDKFASLAMAAAAGLTVPPTLLMEGPRTLAHLGATPWPPGPVFVKPNTLGAKIGIFADSRCADIEQARALSVRLWDRYGDRAVVQPFIEGDDVRLSFMDLGGDFAEQLGIARLQRDQNSETGGAFLTMHDNRTLSGAADTEGGRGAFGTAHAAAFIPRMVDLRTETDARARRAVAEITDAAVRLADLLQLCDYFSMDFRMDQDGRATFLEYEICPAVTIYDFQHYLRTMHGRSLGEALGIALPRAHARHGLPAEA